MSEAERPDRAFREVAVADIMELVHASTPHFALQIRNRIATLIGDLPPEHPARVRGELEIAKMVRLGYAGETRGEPAQDGERPLPSLELEPLPTPTHPPVPVDPG